ncbi:fluoride efflux transporter FluC [Prochlorococcus marinus]|uniref:Fluoride-specific ion channel FluC n=1 Tax=Prochlorococcus marinus (strain MIT 9211) TaxID=93059 RepID=A9BD77_PROM4|nr:CrcB family protein [Prochlorococcus marinus]ABX09690.1 Integral membrane protein possibly involved in chromosome condensation [Prochlorococcus marinus str. MIT 9211]
MFDLSTIAIDLFLVALGSILGAFLRFEILNTFNYKKISKHWLIFTINIISCFLLGLLVALDKRLTTLVYSQLLLFIGVGFLGSFSTFSSFIWEVFDHWKNDDKSQSLLIIASSILGGFVFLLFGYHLGNG